MQPDFFSGNNAPISDKPQEYGINSLPLKSRKVLAEVISGRIQLLRETISEIQTQIVQRQKLRDTMNAEINGNMCRVQNVIYDLDSLPDLNPNTKVPLEGKIMDLFKEKRHLELSHFQDIVMLKRELRRTEKELRCAMIDLWMLRFLK